MKRLLLPLMLAGLLAAPSWADDYKVNLRWDRYYNGAEVEDALRRLTDAFPRFTELRSIGTSEEGRDIWLLTVNNPATGDDLEKPGIYVDGAIHGNEIQA
ncbi:peptidase M14, partial [bacterium]|nr:peptidase M14 [bacterium]